MRSEVELGSGAPGRDSHARQPPLRLELWPRDLSQSLAHAELRPDKISQRGTCTPSTSHRPITGDTRPT